MAELSLYHDFTIKDRIKPKTFDQDKQSCQGVAWAHQKRNGHRVTVFRGEEAIKVIPRKEHLDYADALKEFQPHIWRHVMRLPPLSILDCELEAFGRHASDVITGLKTADVKLALYVFATPFVGGIDYREHPLDQMMERVARRGFDTPPLVDVSKFLATKNIQTTLLDWAIRDKHEGWVLKDAHYAGWWKLKPVKTLDCVVMRQTRSDSLTKYGDLKAVIVGCYDASGKLVEIANVGAGFSDAERTELVGRDLTGLVCEVEYQDILAKGRLQFPRFLRWRSDKHKTECLLEEAT